MNFNQAIQTIQDKLRLYSPRKLEAPGLVRAGILIPIFEKEGEAHLLLTLRTDSVEHHKGQISFPGGAAEEQDESIMQTALRETEEEIGLKPRDVRILGELDDFITVTNFLISPFVGTFPYPYAFQIHEKEVAELLEVPLEIFLTNEHFEIKEWNRQGKTYPVYFYYYQDYVIWGATAFILNRFIEQVFEYNPAPSSIAHDPRYEEYLRENVYRKGTK